ncbi:hypothetical protein [Caulobacter sp. DWP3-1-3b2]|uniref:hypothetical protein n=1 Tax=unclassified Caulobacter TaxID=2648921 RepID=UPI003CE8713D
MTDAAPFAETTETRESPPPVNHILAALACGMVNAGQKLPDRIVASRKALDFN